MTRMISRLRALIGLGISMILLAGCVSLLPGGGNAAPRYSLNAVTYEDKPIDPIDVRLIIEDPVTEEALDSSAIAISTRALQYQYFTTGEWADRAPRLFALVMQRSFQNSGQVKNVGDRTTQTIADYILISDLRGFNMVSDGSDLSVHIVYHLRLTRPNGETVAAREFSVIKPTGSRSLSTAMQIFDQSLQSLMTNSIDWVAEAIQADLAKE